MAAFKIRLPHRNLIRSVDYGGVAYRYVDRKMELLVDDSSVRAIDAAVSELQEQIVVASTVEQEPNETVKAVAVTKEGITAREMQATGSIQDDSSMRAHLWSYLVLVVTVGIYKIRSSS